MTQDITKAISSNDIKNGASVLLVNKNGSEILFDNSKDLEPGLGPLSSDTSGRFDDPLYYAPQDSSSGGGTTIVNNNYSYNIDTGNISFSGVQVIGSGTNSGDGNGYATLELVPDKNLYNNNQYLVVDPTAPNHVHIRAGGTQDASNAELIIGGEQANVKVTDYNHQVQVNTYNSDSTPYQWNFNNDGSFGLASGGIRFSDNSLQTQAGLVSNPNNIPGASAITNIVQISQANYNNLSNPDPNTLYIIN